MRFKEGQAVSTLREHGSEKGTISHYVGDGFPGIVVVTFSDGVADRFSEHDLVAWSDVFTAQTVVNLPMKVHPDIVRLAEAFLDVVGVPAFTVAEV